MWRWKSTANLLRKWVCAALILCAAAIRLWRLDQRPMHADEAVQAARLAELLESGRVHYNPAEFHGPALILLAAPFAWVFGEHSWSQLSENTLRAVAALAGLAAVGLAARIAALLCPQAVPWAIALTALAPGLVYFSRSFIPEILLTAFSGLLLYATLRYQQAPARQWLILAGMAAGAMFATKETAVLAFAALAAASVTSRMRLRPMDLALLALSTLGSATLLFGPHRLIQSVT